VAPLRERRDDILILADLFVQEFNAMLKKHIRGYGQGAQQVLLAYAWPGNVRELRNVTERGMILCQGDVIPISCLPGELQQLAGTLPEAPPARVAQIPPTELPDFVRHAGPFGTLGEVEERYIREVLASVSGNRSRAAKVLGISRSTLQDKIRRYGLS